MSAARWRCGGSLRTVRARAAGGGGKLSWRPWRRALRARPTVRRLRPWARASWEAVAVPKSRNMAIARSRVGDIGEGVGIDGVEVMEVDERVVADAHREAVVDGDGTAGEHVEGELEQ